MKIVLVLLLCLLGLATINAQMTSDTASGSASGTATPATVSGTASGSASPATVSGTASPGTVSGTASGSASPATVSGTASPSASQAGTVSGTASGTASAAGTVSGTASPAAPSSPAASSSPPAAPSSPPAGASSTVAGATTAPAGATSTVAGATTAPAGATSAPAPTQNSGSNPPFNPSAIQQVPVTFITDNANLQSAVANVPTGQFAEFVQSDGSHNFIANLPSGYNQLAVAAPPAKCGNGVVEGTEQCDDSTNGCCEDCVFKAANSICQETTAAESNCAKYQCVSNVCTKSSASKVTLTKQTKKKNGRSFWTLKGTRCEPNIAAKTANFSTYSKNFVVKAKGQPKGQTKLVFCDGTGTCNTACKLKSDSTPTLGC